MPTLKPFTPPKRPRLPAAGISTSCGCLPEGKLRGTPPSHGSVVDKGCLYYSFCLFYLHTSYVLKPIKYPRKSHLPGLGIYFLQPEKHSFPGRRSTQFSVKNHKRHLNCRSLMCCCGGIDAVNQDIFFLIISNCRGSKHVLFFICNVILKFDS